MGKPKNSTKLKAMKWACAVSLTALLAPIDASAYSDAMLEGAKLCTRNLPRQERNYGIPNHLLSAIATTESGRWHDGLKMALPWPWTINAEGKGYYFNSKQEAIKAVNDLKAQGVKSIDVGCMQVNLHHHPTAFSSLESAFDPATNVEYAAKFLRGNYEEIGSWQKAAANYHSRTPARGNQYVARVFGAWRTILSKLDAARYAGGMPVATSTPYVRSVADITPVNAVPEGGKRVTLADASSSLPAHQTPRMKVIKVEDKNKNAKRENGVMVIRVKPAEQMKVASASPAEKKPTTPKADAPTQTAANDTISTLDPFGGTSRSDSSIKVVRLNGETVTSTISKRSGPNFIFSN